MGSTVQEGRNGKRRNWSGGQRPDQARPSRPQEAFEFYFKGDEKPLKGLRQRSDIISLQFPKDLLAYCGKNELEGARAEGKRPVRSWCHGGLSQAVSRERRVWF